MPWRLATKPSSHNYITILGTTSPYLFSNERATFNILHTHLSITKPQHPHSSYYRHYLHHILPDPKEKKFVTVLEDHNFTGTIPDTTTHNKQPVPPNQWTHPWYTLTTLPNLTRCTTQGNAPYFQLCHAFSYTAHYITWLKHTITSRSHLHLTLTAYMYRPHIPLQPTPQQNITNILI